MFECNDDVASFHSSEADSLYCNRISTKYKRKIPGRPSSIRLQHFRNRNIKNASFVRRVSLAAQLQRETVRENVEFFIDQLNIIKQPEKIMFDRASPESPGTQIKSFRMLMTENNLLIQYFSFFVLVSSFKLDYEHWNKPDILIQIMHLQIFHFTFHLMSVIGCKLEDPFIMRMVHVGGILVLAMSIYVFYNLKFECRLEEIKWWCIAVYYFIWGEASRVKCLSKMYFIQF